MLTGPDCSHWQGNVNWEAVRAAGHDFAIIKATEGTSYSHTNWFRENWQELRRTGMTPGAYHFLRTSDPARQARYFVATVGDFSNALAVVDVETAANGSKPGIAHVRDFAAMFKRLVPNHPLIVYTGRWYWHGTIGNPPGMDIGPLWHSEYDTGREVADGPELDNYGGWSKATIWQYTSTGRCPGVSGNCDLNIFYGTRAELRALTGTRPPEPEPEKENPDMLIVTNSRGHGLLLSGSAVYGIDNTSLEGLEKAGVPKAKVSDSVFSELNSHKS
jgi:lysozyme